MTTCFDGVQITLVASLMITSMCLGDSESQRVFDDLYMSRIAEVTRTPSREDDVMLAKELLSTGAKDDLDASLVAIACETAFELAMRSKDGYSTGAAAMRLLAEKVRPAERKPKPNCWRQ